ncbi:GNAT family N-acetyltransferase [Actinophytocola sp.]|uniref:GNAT family N-acetyltransferase n=1 Tax=Actinophytocola sp. TaxID=1872138 RepID=UPI003D6A7E21
MADTLPDGYGARAPGLDDVGTIAGLVREYTHTVLGFADCTEDDVRDELTEPGFEPEHDARLVFDARGTAAGFAVVIARGDSEKVEIDVVASRAAVSRWLFAWALDRARELGRARGHARVTVGHGVYRADEPLREQAAAHGFRVATTFHRMCVDHAGHVEAPRPPDGLVMRQGTEPAVREAAHAILTAAFTEHFGYVPKPYGTWHESHERMSTFDWSQLWVAEVDGRPAAVLECNDRYAADENCGYVAELGVLHEARGRGVAKFLLRHAFATDAAAGRAGTILHVDTNNTTPALGLYESVGMRPTLVVDAWRRTVEVAPARRGVR